jgi:hypothetical protein
MSHRSASLRELFEMWFILRFRREALLLLAPKPLLIAAMFCGAGALADETPPPPHERRGDPPAPPRVLRYSPIADRKLRTRDTFVSMQVNTNADGLNVVGDAANETSLARDPVRPNRLAIGWRQFDSLSSSFREAGFAWSRDGGHTWTNGGVLAEGEFRTDPVLDFDLNSNLYYHSLFGTGLRDCDVYKSVDGGRTWGPPVRAGGGDKNWLVVDRSGGIGDGNVYTMWRHDFSCCGLNTFNRSIDTGLTFSPPVPVPNRPTMVTMAVGPEGELYVAGVNIQNRSQFFVVKSLSARDPTVPIAFEQAVTVPMNGTLTFNTETGPNPDGLLGQPWIAVDHSEGAARGNVYVLTSLDPTGADPQDVHFVRSTDGGATWSQPVRVNDTTAAGTWQWFGTLGIAPSGRLDVVWCDTAASGQLNLSEIRYSFSADAGLSWSPSVPITQIFDSQVGWPNQRKIGDYYQLVSDDVGASLAYAATFNGEQDVYFLRIGDYDCNGNGVGDQTDILLRRSFDLNEDGVPDECQCLGDLNADLRVDLEDLSAVLAVFGSVHGDPEFDPTRDADDDGQIGLSDLAIVLSGFGLPCP